MLNGPSILENYANIIDTSLFHIHVVKYPFKIHMIIWIDGRASHKFLFHSSFCSPFRCDLHEPDIKEVAEMLKLCPKAQKIE